MEAGKRNSLVGVDSWSSLGTQRLGPGVVTAVVWLRSPAQELLHALGAAKKEKEKKLENL